MKKTLQEERDRILEISRSLNNIQTINESLLLPHHLGELKIAVEKYVEEDQDWSGSKDPEEMKAKLLKMVESFFDTAMGTVGSWTDVERDEENNLEPDNEDEGPDANDFDSEGDEYGEQFNKNMSQGFGELKNKKETEEPVQQETDEYRKRYDKNMTQGFSNINEDNTFVDAAKKALTEGKDTFKLKGKKYRVTLSKSKK